MTEYRSDKALLVEVERRGQMALVTVRTLLSESMDEEGRPVYEYDFHQFEDLYTDELEKRVADSIDAVILACIESERRQEIRDKETRYNTAKVLEQQNLNAMLATTELYEMLIGGM